VSERFLDFGLDRGDTVGAIPAWPEAFVRALPAWADALATGRAASADRLEMLRRHRLVGADGR